jgi:hypothetical protein
LELKKETNQLPLYTEFAAENKGNIPFPEIIPQLIQLQFGNLTPQNIDITK